MKLETWKTEVKKSFNHFLRKIYLKTYIDHTWDWDWGTRGSRTCRQLPLYKIRVWKYCTINALFPHSLLLRFGEWLRWGSSVLPTRSTIRRRRWSGGVAMWLIRHLCWHCFSLFGSTEWTRRIDIVQTIGKCFKTPKQQSKTPHSQFVLCLSAQRKARVTTKNGERSVSKLRQLPQRLSFSGRFLWFPQLSSSALRGLCRRDHQQTFCKWMMRLWNSYEYTVESYSNLDHKDASNARGCMSSM